MGGSGIGLRCGKRRIKVNRDGLAAHDVNLPVKADTMAQEGAT
jgi:hypothetical protein